MYNGVRADDQAHIIRYLDPSMWKQIKIWRTWPLEHEVIAFFPLALRRSFSYLLFAFKSLMVLLKGFKTVFIVNIDAIV